MNNLCVRLWHLCQLRQFVGPRLWLETSKGIFQGSGKGCEGDSKIHSYLYTWSCQGNVGLIKLEPPGFRQTLLKWLTHLDRAKQKSDSEWWWQRQRCLLLSIPLWPPCGAKWGGPSCFLAKAASNFVSQNVRLTNFHWIIWILFFSVLVFLR